jgi:predicted DCC family thiol-disulfide oxidoreductase YuxK
MNTLKDHLILFDAECPMCQLYTKAFVSTGLLDKNGRAAYQEYPEQACALVDWQRAVNEIALVNQKTGEVTYGIESLLKICAVALPVLRPLFSFKPFLWLMSTLYAFVSYNRRVIIPGLVTEQSFRFQPGFKKHYRIAYLTFSWLVTSYILFNYGKLMTGILPQANISREFIICGGQIVFQAFVILFYKKEKIWDYLGNLMTISLAGALLLLTISALGNLLHFNSDAYFISFIIVVSLMFLEHIRRSKILKISYLMTFTWVVYRVIALILIFSA